MTDAPRYFVRRREHHGGGLFELEVDIVFEVVDAATGEVVHRWDAGWSASYDGVGWADQASSSLDDVAIAEDGAHVELRFSGGRVERVPIGAGPR